MYQYLSIYISLSVRRLHLGIEHGPDPITTGENLVTLAS
jgi:hypothetical protein